MPTGTARPATPARSLSSGPPTPSSGSPNCSSPSRRQETEEMLVTPEIETRTEQPYVALRARVPMDGIAAFAVRTGEVFGWLGARGLTPTGGPPFLKFNLIDMERELEIENGVPVTAPADGDDLVVAGVLPAGRYVTVTHTGHPSELVEVTGALLD